ncbi:MAG: hypothetical protein Q4G19_00540 [Clostridia bacterium]|nr:hypothetical protein [Clostridia bacterium]
MAERIAYSENRIPEKQIFFDLPRTEPRRTDDDPDSAPPDLKDHDALKDSPFAAGCRTPDGILFMRPFAPENGLPFTVFAENSVLTILTGKGSLECCFEDPETLRIRGTGFGLRFYAPLQDHEAAVDRQDGTFQVDIEAACEFLFVPLHGSAIMDNEWDLMHGGTRRLLLTILPDQNGLLDIAVHMASSGCERKTAYLPFDECRSFSGTGHIAEVRNGPSESDKKPFRSAAAEWPAEAVPETAVSPDDLMHRPLYPVQSSRKPLLSSTGEFDLRSAQFSRRGSFLCIMENDEDRDLYISVTRSSEMWAQRLHLIRMTPVLGGTELPFEYEVEPGRMIIRTCAGIMECCFDREGRLHIRGTGFGLRMEVRLQPSDGFRSREHGAWEAVFATAGRVLFVPAGGTLHCGTCPDSADKYRLECVSAGGSVFEAVLENSYDDAAVQTRYMPFDDCVRDAESDFGLFRKRFPLLPEKYRERSLQAAWVIWTHTLGPSGRLTNSVVYMTRSQWIRAFSWQQSFQAMASGNDIHAAWALLLNMFDYTDRVGQLPDSIGDIGGTWRVTKPALQGPAMLYLMNRSDTSALTGREYEQLYTGMTRTARWWLTFRDRNQSGLPQYFHADESPGEFCSVFRKGVPLYAADIASFVALTAEACGKLAGLLGKGAEEEEWYGISREIIRKMTERLWNGDRFQARLVKTGEIVNSKCVLAFLPVMLGSRLPKEIMDRMLSHLTNEREYLSPYGITAESMEDGTEQMTPQGTVVTLNTLFCMALTLAGEDETARGIASRALKLLTEKGFCYLDVRQETAREPEDPENLLPRVRRPAPAAKWTAWTCACFFILGSIVSGEAPSAPPQI